MKPELCRYCTDGTLLICCEVQEHWEKRLGALNFRACRSVSPNRVIHFTPALEKWMVRRQTGRAR